MLSVHVVGIGVGENLHQNLTEPALRALANAHRVIGSPRQLALLDQNDKPGLCRTDVVYEPLPAFSELKGLLEEGCLSGSEEHTLVVLATGDPLFYGIGRWLGRTLPKEYLYFHPAVSSVQAACHKEGLSLQDATVVSLHGRPLSTLKRHLNPQATLVLLTDALSQPHHIAASAAEAGYYPDLVVCENLGFENECVHRFSARQLIEEPFEVAALNVVILYCGQPVDSYLPCYPGIADDAFVTGETAGKGLLTKRDIRISLLSAMQPAPGDVIWDIGAGCGGVAVELSYWQPDAKVYAVESHAQRLSCLKTNAERFGVVNNMTVVAGYAPEECDELPAPDKVFIGGSGGALHSILAHCWQRLPAGGVIVASAVTEQTRSELLSWAGRKVTAEGAALHSWQVAISDGATLAGQLIYRPRLPVTLFKIIKVEQKSENSND